MAGHPLQLFDLRLKLVEELEVESLVGLVRVASAAAAAAAATAGPGIVATLGHRCAGLRTDPAVILDSPESTK